MKKVLIILAIVLGIVLLGVGGYFSIIHFTKVSDVKTVDDMFNAIKDGNTEEMKKYISIDEEKSSDNTDSSADESTESLKIVVKNLKYDVVSSKTKLNECELKLNVTNKDLKAVITNYMYDAFSIAFSSAFGNKDEKELEKTLIEALEKQYNSEDVQEVTNSVTLNLKKENGKWKISCDNEELLNAILPGYSTISDSLSGVPVTSEDGE